MSIALTFGAFIAGILTFLAPCTLPVVPGYLAFISGVSPADLKDPTQRGVRSVVFKNGLAFVIGFSVIFIALGVVAGLLGALFSPIQVWLSRIGGVIVILFGLYMLGIFNIPALSREKRLNVSKYFKPGKPVNSLALGAAFSVGWTPCVGPILGSILLLVGATQTVFQGAFLLFIFSLGLAVPFLAIALGIGSADRYIQKISPYLKGVSYVGGILLIFLGTILFTNSMPLLISYGYRALEFINYDALIEFL